MSKPRTVASIVEAQAEYPIFVVSNCCENALDDTPTIGAKVFAKLGISHGSQDDFNEVFEAGKADGFYALTPDELEYIAEDGATGPYGGAEMQYVVIYKGRKYLAPTVMVCFDGPDRPFSVGSYGDSDDCIYENSEVAMTEANRLAKHLEPQVAALGGLVHVYPEVESDRHGVMILLPPASVVSTFAAAPSGQRYGFYTTLLSSLFKGYRSSPSKVNA